MIDGQRVFLGNGLMQYGSIFGHGAYLGPDYTADYLHRQIGAMRAGDGAWRAGGADPAAFDSAVPPPEAPAPPTSPPPSRQTSRRTATTRSQTRSPSPTRRSPPSATSSRYYSVLLGADHEVRPASRGDHRPDAAAAADGLLRLDRVGGGRGAARASRTPTPTTGRARPRSATRQRQTCCSGARCR